LRGQLKYQARENGRLVVPLEMRSGTLNGGWAKAPWNCNTLYWKNLERFYQHHLSPTLSPTKAWRRGGHGVLDGGWVSTSGLNFGGLDYQ